MAQSLRSALVPRTPAQWMALLGLIPFGAGAWIQAREQRELRLAQMVVEQRLGELERRTDELTERSGAGRGVRITIRGDSAAGAAAVAPASPALPPVGYDSLADGTRSIGAEVAAVSREFRQLTETHERLRERRNALRGVTAPANLLLAVGALLTLAGVLTDIRQFRQLRRRAA